MSRPLRQILEELEACNSRKLSEESMHAALIEELREHTGPTTHSTRAMIAVLDVLAFTLGTVDMFRVGPLAQKILDALQREGCLVENRDN